MPGEQDPGSFARVRWGVDTWRISDRFLQEWRVRIAPAEQRARTGPGRDGDRADNPLFHLVFQAFDHTGARCDATARDLLDIYCALTGSRIGDALPRPSHDPQRRLRGFSHELSRVLHAAVDAGILKFERHEVPWPFPENAPLGTTTKADGPSPPPPPPPGPEIGGLGGTVTDHGTGKPIAGARVSLSERPGASATTDTSGNYQIGNLPPGVYHVTASARGYSNQNPDNPAVKVVAHAHATQDLRLTKGIQTQTVQTDPGARTRKIIGVGEEVNLTFPSGSATWSVTAGTLSATSGATVVFTAPDTKQTVTVTANGGAAGTATVKFEVLAPTGVFMERATGTGIRHHQGRPDSGIRTRPYLLPDTVNFYAVQWHEVDIGAVATGFYTPFNGLGHDAHPATLSCSTVVVAGKGTRTTANDTVYSGDPGTPAPFAPGSITFSIPWEYRVGTGPFRRFAVVHQESSLGGDVSSLNSNKAGASGSTTVASPTSNF